MHREEAVGRPTAEGRGTSAVGRLLSVFCEVFGVPPEQVHPDLEPGDLARWDSIGHITLIAAIEQTFSIRLDIDEITEITSFGTAVAVIKKKLG